MVSVKLLDPDYTREIIPGTIKRYNFINLDLS